MSEVVGWAGMEKIPMEGLNASAEMVEVCIRDSTGLDHRLMEFPRLLARDRINIHFFVGLQRGREVRSTCGVASVNKGRLKALAEWEPHLKAGMECHDGIVLLSVFPHQFDLKAVGSALSALAEAKIPLRGFCSSLSALTFMTEPAYIEKAVMALRERFHISSCRTDLPEEP
jgi:aspartokinase